MVHTSVRLGSLTSTSGGERRDIASFGDSKACEVYGRQDVTEAAGAHPRHIPTAGRVLLRGLAIAALHLLKYRAWRCDRETKRERPRSGVHALDCVPHPVQFCSGEPAQTARPVQVSGTV